MILNRYQQLSEKEDEKSNPLLYKIEKNDQENSSLTDKKKSIDSNKNIELLKGIIKNDDFDFYYNHKDNTSNKSNKIGLTSLYNVSFATKNTQKPWSDNGNED